MDFFISNSGSYYVDKAVLQSIINATAGSTTLGYSVASGDVNNDSYADIIVGAYKGDASTVRDNSGRVYVFFGTANSINDISTYGNVDNANITFNGTTATDQFGYSVASGDVNNDSYADIIVGARFADPSGVADSDAGQAYVFFGADYPNAVGISYNSTEDANLTFNGTIAADEFGRSVGSGDVNNDSYADVIVGANNADPSGASSSGQAYVFFGADYPSAVTISYNALQDSNLTLNGTAANDYFGSSVGSGDVNNDSYADVIVGAYAADPSGASNAGQAYVFFGADYPSAVGISYNSTEDANLTFNGTTATDQFGYSVGSGDVNNDSYADIIVGARFADPSGAGGAGQAYVFFGADYPSAVGISYNSTEDANLTFNGTTASDEFGRSVGSGDVNNDSYADVIVGARMADPSGASNAGQAYVFFGADYPSAVGISYNSTEDANLTFNGTAENDWFGWSVASGDVNNNSYADIIVGAWRADPSGVNNAGQVYVFEYDDVSPVISLDLPVDNGYDTDGDVNFSFTAVEPNSGDKCTLWFRSNETNWAQNDSASYSNNIQTSVFVNLTDVVYVWSFECNDTGNNPAFASVNRTLTVDRVAPVTPTVTEPSDVSINPRDSISYTCESSDATAGINKWAWTLTKPDSTTVTKTGGEVVSNSQSFSSDETNLAGTYTVKCEVEDKAGHKSSSSKTFEVHYTTVYAGESGAGPSGAADIDFTTEEETTITEKQGTVQTFTLDGITIHTLKIKSVDETAGTVTIIIESEPVEITLTIGETEEVDVDADGINDISVTLNGITKGVADITTKRLTPLPKKEVPTEEVPPTEAPEEEITPEAAPRKAWQWILVTVILVVIGVGYYFMKKKK